MLVLVQDVIPSAGDNPWVWIAGIMVVAGGTLFWELQKSKDKHIETKDKEIGKGEKREDRLIADAATFAPTIREQGTAVTALVGAVEKSFEVTVRTSERVDGLTLETRNQAVAISSLQRTLETFIKDQERNSTQTRRSADA